MKPEKPLPYHENSNILKTLERVHKVLSGNISYGNLNPLDQGRNIDIYPATAITPVAVNTQFVVNHGLNRIPVGFHVVNKDAAVDVYKSLATPWTVKQIFLKADVGSVNITLLIF